jgi:hypothetical protein
MGGGATGGKAGNGGNAGSTGGGGAGGSGPDVCNFPSISKTAPTVDATITPPAGNTLIGGYYAEGDQIYTCVPKQAPEGGAPEAGASEGGSGEAGTAPAGGTWANTAEAIVYGDNCAKAADHGYTATPGSPFWKATDGSQVTATRAAAVAAPVADAGDAGATAITWVLLRATANTGTGLFTPVTYVQRLNTSGGIGPSGDCEPGDASATRRVHYTATYYFYKAASAEGGTEGGTPEASTEGGGSEGGGNTEGGTTEAGAD